MAKLKYAIGSIAGVAALYLLICYFAWDWQDMRDWKPVDRFCFLLMGGCFAMAGAWMAEVLDG